MLPIVRTGHVRIPVSSRWLARSDKMPESMPSTHRVTHPFEEPDGKLPFRRFAGTVGSRTFCRIGELGSRTTILGYGNQVWCGRGVGRGSADCDSPRGRTSRPLRAALGWPPQRMGAAGRNRALVGRRIHFLHWFFAQPPLFQFREVT